MTGVAQSERETVPCSYCTGPVSRDVGPRCAACAVYIHVECANEFEGCPTFGCQNSPDMRKYQSGEGI